MENRGDVKSGCKGVLLCNSGRNSGVRALGTDSGRTGSVRTQDAREAYGLRTHGKRTDAGTELRTHRTHGTRRQHRWRQDAVRAHQMHVFFLLM